MYTRLLLVVILFPLLFSACAADYKAKVESNTRWSGAFGNRTVDGNGSSTVDLDDEEIVCCTVQKQTESGYLKVTIIDDNSTSLSSGDLKSAETSARYGVVSVCNK